MEKVNKAIWIYISEKKYTSVIDILFRFKIASIFIFKQNQGIYVLMWYNYTI